MAPPIKTITSLTNQFIKEVVELHDAKGRKKAQLCIVEGKRAIETALKGLQLVKLYCTEYMEHDAHDLTDPTNIIAVSPAIMKKISTATTPSGLLGVFKIPSPPSPEKLKPGLVLAQISDPGNMGTLIRTAAACGIKSVVVIEGTDPWSPKALQASAGTTALVDIFSWDWQTLVKEKRDLKLYGLVVRGGEAITAADSAHALLVVGNEAQGLPDEWIKQCDKRITLPMPGETESLNAAIAGSIALYLTFVRI